jgi:hypothetical protein
MSRPVIAVIGATGAQGGGLAQAILNDPQQRFAPQRARWPPPARKSSPPTSTTRAPWSVPSPARTASSR